MNVVIVGAGKSGLYLAQELKGEHDVTLIEERFDRSDVVAAMMPDVHVVHGDACETEVLEHAQIGSAALVIAATGDDEDNLVVAMLSKHFGAEKVFARINHPKNEWLFTKEFGVDVPVSSTSMMLSLVEKEVGFGDLITLLRLQADNVSIEEITLPPTASAVGKQLMELSLPENCHVMAIITPTGELTIAKGDTLLSAGDELLLISDGQRDDEVCRALGVGKDAIVSAADVVANHEDNAGG
jgi:trk system potassium uptake protein TrkA